VPAPRLLDAAQGPLHPAARETLMAAVDAGWADPRRLYAEGRRARALLDQAREIIATGIGVRAGDLSFHSSGADALATGLTGLLHARRRRGRALVASAVEHSVILSLAGSRAVAHPREALVSVDVDEDGRVDLDRWGAAVSREDVAVAALQHANAEVGTIQPLGAASRCAAESGVPLLCDAQASLGRVSPPRDCDVLVGSAASFAGPPAVGLLAVRPGTRFALPGRRREAELGRADVDPWVPLVLAAAEAWRQVEATREEEESEAYRLTARLREELAAIEGLTVVGPDTGRLPHVVTASALYVDGETVVHELARRDLLVASGSACTASTLQPSHVLAAMGALSQGNVRVTLPLRAVSPERAADVAALPAAIADIVAAARAGLASSPQEATPSAVVDARGTLCPQPVIEVARWWRANPDADHVVLQADDAAARVDVPAWCRMTGRTLREVRDLPDGGTAYEIGSAQRR
jgi:cysteine desulfurase